MASLPFAFSQMFPLPVIALGLGFFPTWSSDFLHHFLSLLLLYPPALVFSSAIHSSCLICPSPGPVAAVCAGSQSRLCFASIGDVFPYLLFPCFVEKKRFSMIFLSGTFIVKNSTHSNSHVMPSPFPMAGRGTHQDHESLSYRNQAWRKSPKSQSSAETSAEDGMRAHFTLSCSTFSPCPAFGTTSGRSHRFLLTSLTFPALPGPFLFINEK